MFISKQSLIVRNQEIFASEIDQEVVMMDEAAGHYFGLNPVAAKIWHLLKVAMTYDELIATLMAQYEVSQEKCEADVSRFLQEMQQRNLISLSYV